MAQTTITQALAEIKTIGRRIEQKHEFIRRHLMRPRVLVDPLQDDGGSVAVVAREM